MQSYKYDTVPSKGKEPAVNGDIPPSQPSFSRQSTISRPQVYENTFDRPELTLPDSRTAEYVGSFDPRRCKYYRTSSTWSSSNADINLLSEEEGVYDPAPFVVEYNRLARKHGVRPLILGDFSMIAEKTTQSLPNRKGSWISRMLHHEHTIQPAQPTTNGADQVLRHRRSISEIALNFVHHQRKEGLKDKSLHILVRLCGKSIFYLPPEYAQGALVLPTCLRATAQYLVQHATTSGIFRVPGSTRVINALYEYYCADLQGEDIATTTRCPNLPSHLNCGVHDVASTFKRFLAGLPGGILGSLSLFDAFVAINSQFHSYAEANRTKESKLRARLIALAISTVRSKYQRDLICAVFGLLCLVGRAAENAPREDRSGRPLPTSDLMSYGALAIIFGPLLVGDLLSSYSMKLADPASGLVILPVTPCKSGKHRRLKTNKPHRPTMLTVDRILVANDITEMILMHWRDVVRHLKSLDAIKNQKIDESLWRDDHTKQKENNGESQSFIPATSSERGSVAYKKMESSAQVHSRNKLHPTASPTPSSRLGSSKPRGITDNYQDQLSLKRQRLRPLSATPLQLLSRDHSKTALSPTVEESPSDGYIEKNRQAIQETSFTLDSQEPGQLPIAPVTISPLPMSRNNLLLTSQSETYLDQKFQDFRSDDVPGASNSDKQHIQLHLKPTVTGEMMNQASFSSQGTTKRRAPNVATSDTDHKKGQRSSVMESSTAGHTPIHISSERLQTSFTAPDRLTLSGNDVGISHSLSNPRVHEFSVPRIENEMKSPIHVNENLAQPLETPHRTVVSEESLSISLCPDGDKSPSYHPSANDPVRTPPEYVPQYQLPRQVPDAYQKAILLNQVHTVEKSSARSLRDMISDKIVLSTAAKTNVAGHEAEEPLRTPTRRPSAATRWKELVQNSPSSSPNEIKEKRKARTMIHDSGNNTKAYTPNSTINASSLRWKRQPSRESEEKKDILRSSPESRAIFEKPKVKEILSASSSTGAVEFSSIEPLPTTQTSSVSQRSTSKPISGTVRSIAARFDNVSQESTPIQIVTGHSRSHSSSRHSRNFLSDGARVESSAKSNKRILLSTVGAPPKLAEEDAYKNSTKSGSTPSRFRASISRISHGLRPGIARSNGGAIPSKLSKISLQPSQGFIPARDEPQLKPSKQSQRSAEPGSLLSLDKLATSRVELPVALSLKSTPNPPYASPRAMEDFLMPKEDLPKPGSGNGNGNSMDQTVSLYKKQLDLEDPKTQGHDKQLNAPHDIDVRTLSDQLRQAKRECQIWRQRAETAEQRIAVYERFTDKFRDLRGGIENIANGDGMSTDPNSSSSSSYAEDKTVFKNRMRRSLMRRNVRGINGSNSLKIGKEFASGFLDVDQKDEGRSDISMARAKLWIAAEELLNDQETAEGVAE